MGVYLILLVTLTINSFLQGKLNFLAIICFWAISSFRYKTGLDYENYDYYFSNLPENVWNFEFGFHLLSLSSNFIGINPYLFHSTIFFIILAKWSKKEENKFLISLFLIFFFFYGFWNLMSVLRQSLALIFIFYIFCRNEISFKGKIGYYLIASSIHYSSIFFILVIELSNTFKIKKLMAFSIILISFLLLLFKIDVAFLIPSKYKYALEIASLIKPVGISLRFVEFAIITTISYFLSYNELYERLKNLAFFQIIFYSIFSSISYLSERFNVYFEIFYALLFAHTVIILIKKIKPQIISRSIISMVCVCFVTFRYYRFLYKADYSEIPVWENTNKDRVIPYQSIFHKNPERGDNKKPSKFF